MSAGELLRRWRGDRSQADVAQSLGIHQSTLARLEAGAGDPRLGLASRIALMTDGKVPISAWSAPLKKARRKGSGRGKQR